jgi:hypothetical protein
VIEAIKAGVPGAAVKDEMTTLEAKRVKLHAQCEAAPPPMPRLHPNLAELYRQKVMNLAEALNDEHTRLEAAECIRELIEEIRLVPENGKLRVDLYGELAALINLAATMTSSQPVAVTPNGKRGQHLRDIANGVNKESRAIPTLRWHRRLYLIRIKTLATFEA